MLYNVNAIYSFCVINKCFIIFFLKVSLRIKRYKQKHQRIQMMHHFLKEHIGKHGYTNTSAVIQIVVTSSV